MIIKVTNLQSKEREIVDRLLAFGVEVDGKIYNYLEDNPRVMDTHKQFMRVCRDIMSGKVINMEGRIVIYNRIILTTMLYSIYRTYKEEGVNRNVKFKWWEVSATIVSVEESEDELVVSSIPRFNEEVSRTLTIKLPVKVVIPDGKEISRVEISLENDMLSIRITFRDKYVSKGLKVHVTNRCYSYTYLMGLTKLPWMLTAMCIEELRKVPIGAITQHKTNRAIYHILYEKLTKGVSIGKIETIDRIVYDVSKTIHEYIKLNKKVPKIGEVDVGNVVLGVKEVTVSCVCTDIGGITPVCVKDSMVGTNEVIGILKKEGKRLWIELKKK